MSVALAQPMLVDSLITSAGGHYFLGGFADALASAEECTEVSESIGNVRGQAVSLYVLGAIYMELGEIGKAIAALDEAILLSKQIGFHPPVDGPNTAGPVPRYDWGHRGWVSLG